MFKSIFARYITVFMLIILISFIVLIFIMTSTVNNYAYNSKSSLVENSAYSAASYLQDKLGRSEISDFSAFVALNESDITAVMKVVTSKSPDISILITDVGGNIIHFTEDRNGSHVNPGVGIPKSLMDELINGGDISDYRARNELFENVNAVDAAPVINGNGYVCGTVFVCSSSGSMDELRGTMSKTMLIASLWIMLIALVAVYFISEKVIAPLKDMSNAAKSFASGKFDIRIPVRGSDEVAQLAEAFNNMAESLSNLETMRNTFMANVSHDLRTPMTTIAGFIDGILDGAIPPDKHGHYLGIIAAEVRRLSRLVSSLLDISRIQAGDRKFTMIPFDICEMGRQIVISFERKIDEKKLGVRFDCDDDCMTVRADRDAIYQIFYNICDNAVKFARNEGLLRISISRYKEKKVLVSVYDEGDGIKEEDIPYVFERFYKADKSRGLDKAGAGLGMFIAQTIIRAHNEEIWVKSEYGKYCEFCFTLAENENPDKGENVGNRDRARRK